MNMRKETTLIGDAIAAVNELGLKATEDRGQAGGRTDATITVHHDGKRHRFQAEVKRSLTQSIIGLVTVAFEGIKDRLLVTDYVTPPVAEELKRRGVQFVDTAGNAFLQRRGLFVFVSGRRPNKSLPAAPRPSRVFQPSGIKILFAILSAPQLLGTQRSIAAAADVALGSVPAVLEGLADLGYLVEIDGTRRLVQRERLVNQWTEAYARVLDPSLELARFAAPADWWRQTDLATHGVQWGGETAAAILQRGLVPERAVIYTDAIPTRLISQYRLKPDPAGKVILRRRFWNSVPSPRADVVPPLLIYADLMTAGDARSIDAAKQIRDAYRF
ncbi:MAG TPA: type IV toxin-antitoxin system AbiEi family antitoxin [Thermoanaerobaculia bacterium]|nr:type IV toxin-antitoxin system AbiEi family antitoxin [Thermoanaerobaculia bacterium]